jgi:hypothetical protein
MASFIMALIVTQVILATFPPRGVGCLMALIMGLYLEICVHLRERCMDSMQILIPCFKDHNCDRIQTRLSHLVQL